MKYAELNEKLTGRNCQRRKLENNTYAERRENDAIAIRLHDTDILTFQKSGRVSVNTGGWKTVTTKARLNEFLPHGLGISQNRGVWHWTHYNGEFKILGIFSDGDTINRNGTVTCTADKNETSRQLKLRKQINAFAALCASKLPLPRPSAGDCWFCGLETQEGKTLGDSTKDISHLVSHMEEEYAVPSLVYKALVEAKHGQMVIAWAFAEDGKCVGGVARCVRSAVRRYMFRRFGMPA